MDEKNPINVRIRAVQVPCRKRQQVCSFYCESAGKEFSIACNCGQYECAGGEAVRAAG
jgi:hypothetical protein